MGLFFGKHSIFGGHGGALGNPIVRTAAQIGATIATGNPAAAMAIGAAQGATGAGQPGGGSLGGTLMGAAQGYAIGAGTGAVQNFAAGTGALGGTAQYAALDSGSTAANIGAGFGSGGVSGGASAIGNSIASSVPSFVGGSGGAAAGGGASSYLPSVLGAGNLVSGVLGAGAAKDAAKIQAGSIDKGIAATTAGQKAQAETLKPFVGVGTDAASQLKTLQSDPTAYIRGNPVYTSLADDAQRRLLANKAAQGKSASGGTKAALQEQLLNLGNGLVQQQVGNLQTQINTGANAAAGVGQGQINTGVNNSVQYGNQGDVNAAGTVGAYNAGNNAYQNQINTILALKGLQRNPTSAPTLSL